MYDLRVDGALDDNMIDFARNTAFLSAQIHSRSSDGGAPRQTATSVKWGLHGAHWPPTWK